MVKAVVITGSAPRLRFSVILVVMVVMALTSFAAVDRTSSTKDPKAKARAPPSTRANAKPTPSSRMCR